MSEMKHESLQFCLLLFHSSLSPLVTRSLAHARLFVWVCTGTSTRGKNEKEETGKEAARGPKSCKTKVDLLPPAVITTAPELHHELWRDLSSPMLIHSQFPSRLFCLLSLTSSSSCLPLLSQTSAMAADPATFPSSICMTPGLFGVIPPGVSR